MSATRKRDRAASKAAEIAERREAKEAAKGRLQTRASVPAKAPSVRPYRKPEPVAKEKRVVRTVSERDGMNLLRKIEAKGGRDIIVMMRDSKQAPQELAEGLLLNEAVVITAVDSYGSGKDRILRLLSAIRQATSYLLSDGNRPVTTGLRKQKRQDEARANQAELAAKKKKPRVRTPTGPMLEEVALKRDDRQIVLEELKRYLGTNTSLSAQVLSVSSDVKAARVLTLNVGQRFDLRVKALLTEPSEYQNLLAEATASIRREVRKHDTPNVPPSIPETPVVAGHQSQIDTWERFKTKLDQQDKRPEPEPDPDDPEEQARLDRIERQEASLRRFLETQSKDS